MRLFCGIRKAGDVLRLAVLNREAEAVLRCEVPLGKVGTEAVLEILDSIGRAYGAKLLVTSASMADEEPPVSEAWLQGCKGWRIVPSSTLCRTPLAREDPYGEFDPYREAMVLAILGSLGEG